MFGDVRRSILFLRFWSPMPRRAFTLIELLVVVAIIGLLSTIAVVSLSSARSKARDAKRMADIHQISNAMQLYRQEYNAYPNPGALGCTGGSGQWFCLGHGDAGTCWIGGAYHGCTALDNALAPYLAKLPDDPNQANAGFDGDAYLYNYASSLGSSQAPLVHWGMEKGPTSSNICIGGSSGTWGSGIFHDSQYWCAVSLP